MNNSVRNSIALAVITLVVSIFFIVQYGMLAKQTKQIQQVNNRTIMSIDTLNVLLGTMDSLKAEYELQKAIMDQQSKVVLGEDSPTVTYGYLLNLLKWNSLAINYDFAATDAKDTLSGTFNEYIVSGSTHYTNLLHLTHQIESQRAVITIEDLSIATSGAAKADTVAFSMVLHTHYRAGGVPAEELDWRKLNPPYTGYSLFKPRVSEEALPYDIDPDLMNVEEAKLIGITKGMAFFRDGQGIIRILTRGSQVAYGYLYRIDEAAGKVIFRLAKFGLEEDYTVLINKLQ